MTDGPAPEISVIVPVYNGAGFLHEALSTIARQRIARIEVVLVDDGSTDNLPQLVAALPQPVRYIRQTNQGLGAAHNRGLREARGELIAFLDIDDSWPEDSLRARLQALRDEPQLALVYGHSQLQRLEPDRLTGSGRWTDFGAPLTYMLMGSVLARRSAFERAGAFDPAMGLADDADWYLKAVDAGLPMRRLERTLHWYRQHDASMTYGKTTRESRIFDVIQASLQRKRAAARRVAD
jgi:glycosyltransferase involved in cell wall biosynthesis